MSALHPEVDPGGLLEYSVVYTDRALNHMSKNFQAVMVDISSTLKEVYKAQSVAIVPGSGTFGMEAVARQFARDKHCLIVRNGWFSYRWTQILERGGIAASSTVLMAQRSGPEQPFSPASLDDILKHIEAEKPAVVFAPHVETASGIMLPDANIKAIADATHAHGGLFVLDCIASGCVWVDMVELGVDILISAPQKGWSGPPCCGLVMLGKKAREMIDSTESDSFAADLKKWLQIMEAYEAGAHAYHATMPTEALRSFRGVMQETVKYGIAKAKADQLALGKKVRAVLKDKGYISVASDEYAAPGVVVVYTRDPDMQTGKRFVAEGLQIAAGVPLMCGEGDDFKSFRFGLFGLDKIGNIERTVASLSGVLDKFS